MSFALKFLFIVNSTIPFGAFLVTLQVIFLSQDDKSIIGERQGIDLASP